MSFHRLCQVRGDVGSRVVIETVSQAYYGLILSSIIMLMLILIFTIISILTLILIIMLMLMLI